MAPKDSAPQIVQYLYTMKSLLLSLLFLPLCALAQPNINSWILNADGKLASQWFNNGGMPPTWTWTDMTDSADALKVCYNSDTVWIRCQGLTDNMGKWLNPGGAVAQNYVFRFQLTPQPEIGTHTKSPMMGPIGLLLNGIPIYGLSNAKSWTGSTNADPGAGGMGIWNVEVGLSEGFVLDTAFGAHPQQAGAYHSHTTPYRLYKNTPAGQHSPIVGWAFDGYPVYGPYGYSDPMDSTSTITRMKSGYSLRSITNRTALPDGSAATQTGPDVSATYPIGTYCEDYEWLALNGGDLDEYNGRFCRTPEFPEGTYAYFVTIDAAGTAAFPYYIGLTYYGKADAGNFETGPGGNGLTMPAAADVCLSPVSASISDYSKNKTSLFLFPNPSNGQVTLLGNGHPYTFLEVYNSQGLNVYQARITGHLNYTFELTKAGLYFVRCTNSNGQQVAKQIFIR